MKYLNLISSKRHGAIQDTLIFCTVLQIKVLASTRGPRPSRLTVVLRQTPQALPQVTPWTAARLPRYNDLLQRRRLCLCATWLASWLLQPVIYTSLITH